MYKIKLLCLIVVSISLLCCNSNIKEKQKENSLRLISINESDLEQTFNFYDIIKDIEFIPLETTNESILGNISKIQFYKNYMIILDMGSRSIFIFDDTGKYINKIQRVGLGPYEYTDINDFCVHPITGEISVATSSKKILTFSFDLKTCTLYDKTPYAIGIERFKNGNYLLASTSPDANIIITDSNMKILHRGIPNRNPGTELITKSFSKFGDTILCRLPTSYNDTIYRVTEDSFAPWCAPDFEVHADYSNLSKYFVDDPVFGKLFLNEEMSMSNSGLFFESNKFILFQMTYQKKFGNLIQYVIYTKKSRKVRVFSSSKLINFSVTPLFSYSAVGENAERVVTVLPAIHVLKCKILKEDAISLRIKKLQGQLDEDSNPVVAFITYKE